jgi:virginiamycin B lyase
MEDEPIDIRARATGVAVLGLILCALVLPGSAGAYVYWANYGAGMGGTIGRANLDGTAPNQSFISGSGVCEVAVDATHIYWTNNITGTIGRANLDGSSVKENFVTGANNVCGIAVDATHIYWTNHVSTGSVGRANLDGTAPDQNFIPGVNFPGAVAVDAAHVYWTVNVGAGAIGRANLDGTAPNQNFIPGITDPYQMAIDGTSVYWTNDGTPATIGRANLDGTGTPNQSFITGFQSGSAYGIGVDGQHLYWSDEFDDTIGRANLDGSSQDRPFITGGHGVSGIAVDSLPHASATTVVCASAKLQLPASTSCTVTVAATTPGPTAPTGYVAFGSSGGGVFGPAQTCALTAIAADQSACQMTYSPSAAGDQAISAKFSGDFANAESSGETSLKVTSSNSFSLSKPKLNERKGTAILTATVPGAGKLVLAGKGIKRHTENALGAGKVRLKILAKKKAAKKLSTTGEVELTAKITFTPVDGDPNTLSKGLTLRKAG